MGFVKLDCRILDSTLWLDRDLRDVFVTALLMAVPAEFREAVEEIATDTLEKTGFVVPPGWYGFVPASGIGILRRAGVEREPGMAALRTLASPESESRSHAFEGRRMVRVDGGFLILNFFTYRDRDEFAAERMRRLRERRRRGVTANGDAVRANSDETEVRGQSAEVRGKKEREGETSRERVVVPLATREEIRIFWAETKLLGDPDAFFDHFAANGWRVGGKIKMRDWRAACRNWSRRERRGPGQGVSGAPGPAASASTRIHGRGEGYYEGVRGNGSGGV
jgi:hypothetical protein